MLQQTQVQTVLGFFSRFMERFPTIEDLANAEEDTVLSLWSGLGYYSRARNLHKTAKIICERFAGQFPKNLDALIDLPGIGASTAAAILAQAYNLPHAILDANVKRVLSRYFMIAGWPNQTQVTKKLWQMADLCMPEQDCAEYTQAIMDLGSLCCTASKPDCPHCPVKNYCQAFIAEEQTNYPNKKPKKPVPLYQQQFLVLSNSEGLIYLEKRPPTGVWGGLWCLPSIDVGICALEYIKKTYHVQGEEVIPLLDFKHRFSHFHLEIKAVGIKIQALANKVGESCGNWFHGDQFSSLGLARPTSRILNSRTHFSENKL
jgi:A/G-specific adenine glycosylase